MTPQECIDRRCKTCQRRTLHKDLGLVCSLTNQKPEFEEDCADYLQDEVAIDRQKKIHKELTDSDNYVSLLAIFLSIPLILTYSEKSLIPLKITGAAIICIGLFFLARKIGILLFHRLTKEKITRIICKYLYAKGYLYKIIDEDIIFNANGLNYYIEIIPFKKYYTIQLNCNIKGEDDLMQQIFCANKTNQCYRYVRVCAYDKTIIFDTILEMVRPSDFKLKFPSRLKLLQDAIDHYIGICQEVSQAMKEKENENSTEPQQEIRTVGEA